ncbi:TrkH family potassium uptake protein [Oceanimonas baumannii]|uniref:Trk system potassium uptake protein n=1 Tax=Oceanimonas baumannii TaxID=129578 RepID=A0A235CF58_9GAMM|nr:TrkH family potassium uptake protein [Oceanimonas baumannii]OYD23261.1 potassium transporter TrkH [Oceanimonas baumannii]TDW58597.1 trk system potassium uptake protein TrkH [Oceanimonas baumannii]
MFNLRPIAFILGMALSKLALFMWLPTLLALTGRSPGFEEFLQATLLTHAAALGLLAWGRREQIRLRVKEMFLLTTLVWLTVCVFGALPFVFISHISFTDAFFETMSGVTTTGSTVLSGLDDMPPDILLWRSILQWLGGVGFIVAAVAVLPYLNVGGMKLFQTESSDWSDKSAPRAATMAKRIVLLYLALTVLCSLGYYALSDMNAFEAVNHAMTTLSTGGYSTSDSSMNHFTPAAHWVGTLFMFIGGLPFLLMVSSLRHRELGLFRDAQVRGFFWLVLATGFILSLYLWGTDRYPWPDAIRISLFNLVSVITTTGYGLEDFGTWGPFPLVLFALLMLCGACSGSTAGGFKIFRLQVGMALFRRQLYQLMHPRAVLPQRYNGRIVSDDIVRSLITFIFGYIATMVLLALGLSLMSLPPQVAITAAVTAVANVGPGIGELIGPTGNFATLPGAAKWLLALGMLMGRLEILTVAVLLIPGFWRH